VFKTTTFGSRSGSASASGTNALKWLRVFDIPIERNTIFPFAASGCPVASRGTTLAAWTSPEAS
jgi:hypothetical protein